MNRGRLKYSDAWFDYGFIDEDNLMEQIEELEQGKDPNTEHYRYKAFLNFIDKHNSFEDEEIENYIKLVEADVDGLMSRNALSKLYTSSKLNLMQLDKVGRKLKSYGPWAEKIVKRMKEKLRSKL